MSARLLCGSRVLLLFALLHTLLFEQPHVHAAPSMGGSTIQDITIEGIQDGEIVTGSVVVEADVDGRAIDWVQFDVRGPNVRRTWYEGHNPYIMGGSVNSTPAQWDTRAIPDGNYTLTVTARDKRGREQTERVQFRVANRDDTPQPGTEEPPSLGDRGSIVDLMPTTCQGRTVRPGQNLQRALDEAGSGATICFQPGTYRLTGALRPKARQTLQGVRGAVLNGASTITGWERRDELWVARDVLPTRYPTLRGTCMPQENACRYPHDVYFDHQPLRRVMQRSAVTAGTFYADYVQGAIYLADDPTGHRVEVGRTAAAIISQANGVVIRGLTVEKFASAAQDGAIFVGGNDSLVELNNVRYNHAVGIKTMGSRSVVRHNYAHHNGQLGLSGVRLVDGLVEGNELSHNNYARFWNFDYENGGGKWTRSEVTVRNNIVHQNKGVGLWFDIDCKGVLAENNRVTDNESDGIRFEISYDGVIRGNLITGNAHVVGEQRNNTSLWMGGGIAINTSARVEITENTLNNNLNGIELRYGDRGSGRYGERDLRDVNVHHNTIHMSQGTTGMVQQGNGSVYTSKNNRFHDNTYHLAGSRQFVWRGDTVTPDQWQNYGNDRDGIFRALLPQVELTVADVNQPPHDLDGVETPTTMIYPVYAPLVVSR